MSAILRHSDFLPSSSERVLSPAARGLLDGLICGLKPGDVAITCDDTPLARELAETGATILAFASDPDAHDTLAANLARFPNAVPIAAMPVAAPAPAPKAPTLSAAQNRLRVARTQPRVEEAPAVRHICLRAVLTDLNARRTPSVLRDDLRAHRAPDRLSLLHLDLGARSWTGLTALQEAGLLGNVGCILVPPATSPVAQAARDRLAPEVAGRLGRRLRLDWV
ncbi:hypothetical protein [Jannaschia aquimarina]|uniref:Uncharacterized protein n=1 Tax=Jannaschia aquimarina TaxID=935700 RepID=A0A0D1EJN2_9RHOB|nr:hypothetical protein [Jannaschia aquimarina]KIT17196.1 hypothetical protein jaqu_09270 [Jannaschia aquimarina]SNT18230.1 hypothetical protein SAMN05421775_10753 [Jannaschia aquimarina]